MFQTQFVAVMLHGAQSLYVGCDIPKWRQRGSVAYGLTILLFFLNFYFHAYIKAARKHRAERKAKLAEQGADKVDAKKEL